MSSLFLGSYAQVKSSHHYIWIIEMFDPELSLMPRMRDYFGEIGYSSLNPNFQNIRIGNIHPFALLRLQEVLGNKLDASIFPSITIANTSAVESMEVLAKDGHEEVITTAMFAKMLIEMQKGTLVCSDEGIAALQSKLASDGSFIATKFTYFTQETIDANIWTENKDMTSLIFDLTKLFFIGNVDILKEDNFDLSGGMSGRRSGDINTELGMLLYGANVEVSAKLQLSCMRIDTDIQNIQYVYPRNIVYEET